MTEDIQETENRGDDGRFKEGNRFWEARATHGRPPLYNDPDHLWRDCCGYFEWTVDNPLCEQRHSSIKARQSSPRCRKCGP